MTTAFRRRLFAQKLGLHSGGKIESQSIACLYMQKPGLHTTRKNEAVNRVIAFLRKSRKNAIFWFFAESKGSNQLDSARRGTGNIVIKFTKIWKDGIVNAFRFCYTGSIPLDGTRGQAIILPMRTSR